MFILNTRLQIAAICFFSIIIFDYLRNKKLPLLSTKCFSAMLVFAGFNLCFDIITVFTITHMSVVPPFLNRLSHQLFIGTLIIMVVFLYMYVEILGHEQKRVKARKLLLTLIPFAISIFALIFGKLDYFVTDKAAYSYGPMANLVYISVAIYSVLILWDTFKYQNNLKKEKRLGIRFAASIWIIATLIQLFKPSLLLSGLALVLMILFVYLSFENPKEHLDEDIGTFNKRAFHLMLNEQRQKKKPLYIISVVIDDLPRIQTSIGHDNANILLEIIGNMMKSTFQTSVYHSRSNVISVLYDKSPEMTDSKMMELEKLINQPVPFHHFNVVMRAHIDMINAYYYCYSDSCDEIYEMMNYMADHKEPQSGTCIRVLDSSIINEKIRRSTIEKMVNTAIENDGFQVIYQPIYDVRTGKFHSAEALIRLRDTETLGFISPEEFIPIAEKKGMIMDLGRIVFEKVCYFAKANDLAHSGVDYIEINLSGIQCVHPDLPMQLKAIMEKYDIAPNFVNLEITETAAVESGERLQENIIKLKDMGCSFSMDDFGTGYSNLSQMAEVQYDLVKIDKSLIWPCFYDNNKNSSIILENVIKMLLQLDVKIVAEGVETSEMTDYLSQHGVTYLQGYHFSRPISENEYLLFIAKKN